jgi:archaellum component FlaF (FlaF/FlaG flagellin family)
MSKLLVGVVVLIAVVVMVTANEVADPTPFQIVDAANRVFEETFNTKAGQDVCFLSLSLSSSNSQLGVNEIL